MVDVISSLVAFGGKLLGFRKNVLSDSGNGLQTLVAFGNLIGKVGMSLAKADQGVVQSLAGSDDLSFNGIQLGFGHNHGGFQSAFLALEDGAAGDPQIIDGGNGFDSVAVCHVAHGAHHDE